MKKTVFGGLCAILLGCASTFVQAETLRLANHGQAGIDAMKSTVERIEKKLGVKVEVVEYPAPDKDYLSKLLTELGAGNGPDLFSMPSTAAVDDMVEAIDNGSPALLFSSMPLRLSNEVTALRESRPDLTIITLTLFQSYPEAIPGITSRRR